MESGRRTEGQKRLCPNQHVSGSVGEFIEGPSKRRRRQRWFGHIVRAVGENKYLVRSNNGEEKECSSNILKVEHIAASLPPDVPVPIPENVREEVMLEGAIAEIEHDAEEGEDLPDIRPEEEDVEQEEEMEEQNEEPCAEESNQNEATQNDAEGRMSGELPTAEQSSVKDYHSIKKAAKEKIAALVGHEVTVGTRSNGTMKWKVVATFEPPDEYLLGDTLNRESFGLKNFSSTDYKQSEVLADIFLQLSFMDWKCKVEKMNEAVKAEKCKCRKFSQEEFLIGLALIIGAAEFSQKGVDFFGSKEILDNKDDDLWHSISASPRFEQYMPFSRFKDFWHFFPSIFANQNKKDIDPWYQFCDSIEEYNQI